MGIFTWLKRCFNARRFENKFEKEIHMRKSGCPICGSHSMNGIHGSNMSFFKCNDCGYSWQMK